MLKKKTARPVFLMKRGIDTVLFSPARRTLHDSVLRIGYVGRLTPEKSVRDLLDVQEAIERSGLANVRFLVVGDGSERNWLMQNLHPIDAPGVLRGTELAEAYANMDVFAFPSRTDTFGNVVLEALASGTPCVVRDAGGPKYIIEEGVTGFATSTVAEFGERAIQLLTDPDLRIGMSIAAREQACLASWDKVFEDVYAGYDYALQNPPVNAK